MVENVNAKRETKSVGGGSSLASPFHRREGATTFCMQWLNKLDDVLDRGLYPPRTQTAGEGNEESHENEADEQQVMEEELFAETPTRLEDQKTHLAVEISNTKSVSPLPGTPQRKHTSPTGNQPATPAIVGSKTLTNSSGSNPQSSSSLPGSFRRTPRSQQRPRHRTTQSNGDLDNAQAATSDCDSHAKTCPGEETVKEEGVPSTPPSIHRDTTWKSGPETPSRSTQTAVLESKQISIAEKPSKMPLPNTPGSISRRPGRRRKRSIQARESDKDEDAASEKGVIDEKFSNDNILEMAREQFSQETQNGNGEAQSENGSQKMDYFKSYQSKACGPDGSLQSSVQTDKSEYEVASEDDEGEHDTNDGPRESNENEVEPIRARTTSMRSIELEDKDSSPKFSLTAKSLEVAVRQDQRVQASFQEETTQVNQQNTISDADSVSKEISFPDSSTLSAPGNGIPLEVRFLSEFEVTKKHKDWFTEQTVGPWDDRLNCRGVVFVKVLRAQRLPCSVGSVVHAVFSLKPWHGRVKSRKTRSFVGPSDKNGVCVEWKEEDCKPIAMTHAYSSSSSPLPSMELRLVMSSLGVLGFTMCTLCLSCEFLLQQPLVSHRQWFLTAGDGTKGDPPLIEIEAVFEPSDALNRVAPPLVSETEAVSPEVSSGVSQMSQMGSRGAVRIDDTSQAEMSASRSSFHLLGNSASQKPHFLKRKTYYTPAICCVCQKSIRSGFSSSHSFTCELCHVDCCDDCRLSVDVELACCSKAAAEAVSNSVQTKLSMQSLLSVVAPEKESLEEATSVLEAEGGKSRVSSEADDQIMKNGIGKLSLKNIDASIFQHPMSPLIDVAKQKENPSQIGNYYVRVTCSQNGNSGRTALVQASSRPHFDALVDLAVSTYGTEFWIELVDAENDFSVGAAAVTAQTLLQAQRDWCCKNSFANSLWIFSGPQAFEESVRLIFPLRAETTKSFGLQNFPLASPAEKKASVVGWLEADICLKENIPTLFGANPQECEGVPQPALDTQILQLHLNRLTAILHDLSDMIDFCLFLVSWRNPVVTLLTLWGFVTACLKLNPEHSGSIPVGLVVARMMYLLVARAFGSNFSYHIARREIEARRKAEKVAVDYDLHRPIGQIVVSIEGGRNLHSPELGLPVNVECHALWDPVGLASPRQSKKISSWDKSAVCVHEIGSTDSEFSPSPSWKGFFVSSTTKRLKQVLSSRSDCFALGRNVEKNEITFPVLQPFVRISKGFDRLEKWSASKACIVFEVRFSTILPGSESILGECVIPLPSLVEQQEIKGWFELVEKGSAIDGAVRGVPETSNSETPQIEILVRWEPPQHTASESTSVEREASLVIQEELTRSAVLVANTNGIMGRVTSSVGALSSLRSTRSSLSSLQNSLGAALDFFESTRNALNFTDPYKSMVLLFTLCFVWGALVVIPTNLVVLCVGLGPFAVSFLTRFGGSSSRSEPAKRVEVAKPKSNPFVTWLINAFRGIPTDEDLRKAYYWESRRLCEVEVQQDIEEKRGKRLERLWRAQWYAKLNLLVESEAREIGLDSVFAVVQGRRFLWWDSTKAFDDGDEAKGQIFLEGHAGISSPSPIEAKDLDPEELSRVACVFGRSSSGQVRVTLLVSSEDERKRLEKAVLSAMATKKD